MRVSGPPSYNPQRKTLLLSDGSTLTVRDLASGPGVGSGDGSGVGSGGGFGGGREAMLPRAIVPLSPSLSLLQVKSEKNDGELF